MLHQYQQLVFTTEVNSAFCARWLVNSEVINKVLFTSEQPKRNIKDLLEIRLFRMEYALGKC